MTILEQSRNIALDAGLFAVPDVNERAMPAAEPDKGPPTYAGEERAVRLVGWLARYTSTILLVSLGIAALSALSLLRLRLDVDLLSMLPQGRQRFADYQRYVARFGAQDVAVAVVRAPDTSTAIRFAAAFEDALARMPEVRGVRSRVDLAAFGAALRAGALPRLLPIEAHAEVARRLTPEAIDEAVRTLAPHPRDAGSVGHGDAISPADPLGLAALLGESLARSRPDQAFETGQRVHPLARRQAALMLIRPGRARLRSRGAAARLAAALHAAEASARARSSGTGHEVEVGYTGAFAFALEDASLLRTDILVYSSLALVGVLAVFLAGYRSLEILPIVTYQILLGTLVTFALGAARRGAAERDLARLRGDLLRPRHRCGDPLLHALPRGVGRGGRDRARRSRAPSRACCRRRSSPRRPARWRSS